MTVDLHRNVGEPEGGVVTFRSGEAFYSVIVGQDEDGDYVVRYEDGVYPGYTRDGLKCRLAYVDNKKRWVRIVDAPENGRDIVAFVRCESPPPGVKYGCTP